MIYIWLWLVSSVIAFVCVWWVRRCRHEWVIIKETKIMSRDNNYKMPVGFEYVMRCKKCGAIKSKVV